MGRKQIKEMLFFHTGIRNLYSMLRARYHHLLTNSNKYIENIVKDEISNT